MMAKNIKESKQSDETSVPNGSAEVTSLAQPADFFDMSYSKENDQGVLIFFHYKIKNGQEVRLNPLINVNQFSRESLRNNFWNDLIQRNIQRAPAPHEYYKYETDITSNFPGILKNAILEKLNQRHAPFYFEVRKLEYGSLDIFLNLVNATALTKSPALTLEVFTTFLEMFAPIALVRSIGFGDAAAGELDVEVELPEELQNQMMGKGFADSRRSKVSEKEGFLSRIDKTLLLARASWIIPVLLAFFIWNSNRVEQFQLKTLYLNKYDTVYRLQHEFMNIQNEAIRNNFYQVSSVKDSTQGKN